MNIELTPELRAALELRHSKVRDGYERDRIYPWSMKMLDFWFEEDQAYLDEY